MRGHSLESRGGVFFPYPERVYAEDSLLSPQNPKKAEENVLYAFKNPSGLSCGSALSPTSLSEKGAPSLSSTLTLRALSVPPPK